MDIDNELISSIRNINIAENLINIAKNLGDDKRIIIKSVIEIQKSISHLILYMVFIDSKKILKDANEMNKMANLFFNKIAIKYFDEKEINMMKSILLIVKKYKESHLEFVRKDKFVIFGEKSYHTITENDVNSYICTIRGVISKIVQKRKV